MKEEKCKETYSEMINKAIDHFEKVAKEIGAVDFEFVEADAPSGFVDIIFYFKNGKHMFISGAIRFVKRDDCIESYEFVKKEYIKRSMYLIPRRT
jgi:hypothetical protein